MGVWGRMGEREVSDAEGWQGEIDTLQVCGDIGLAGGGMFHVSVSSFAHN